MTLRHRVIAVALAALAIIAVLGAQLVLRYADTQRSLSEVVDTLAPASTAVADLNEDVNNMERRLRIYVSSTSPGMGLLYRAAVVSAEANLEELGTLLKGREPDTRLVADVESDLTAWLTTVGDPVTSAMADDKQQVRPGDPGLPPGPVGLRPTHRRHVPAVHAPDRRAGGGARRPRGGRHPAGVDARNGTRGPAPAAAGHLRRRPSARPEADRRAFASSCASRPPRATTMR